MRFHCSPIRLPTPDHRCLFTGACLPVPDDAGWPHTGSDSLGGSVAAQTYSSVGNLEVSWLAAASVR